MNSSTRWRRLWLRATVLACLALGLLAGTASATSEYFELPTAREVSIDADHHWFLNSIRPITYGGYQYIAHWDAEDPRDGFPYLILTRRRLSDGNRVSLRFDTEPYVAYLSDGIYDGHNYVGLGVSPNDGAIHIVWSLHTRDRRMRYWRSATRCTERSQEEFTLANCGFTFDTRMANRAVEESITYPTFINDNEGHLYFTQRNDASSRADQYLYSYDDRTSHAWAMVGKIIRGRITGRESGQERRREEANERANEYSFRIGANEYRAVERGVYIYGMEFDKREQLQVTWAYRDHVAGLVSQHGIYYSYSRDGGRTWYVRERERDTRIATAETEPIDITDRTATQVVLAVPGWFDQGGYMTLDSDNNPHVFVPESDTQTDEYLTTANMRQVHYWRDTTGTWYGQFVQAAGEGTAAVTAYPNMFIDRANIAYAFFTKEALGWAGYNDEAIIGVEYVYHQLLPSDVTWQPDGGEDGFLNIHLHSELTCIETTDYIGAAIETRGTNEIRFRMRNDSAENELVVRWSTQESMVRGAEREQAFRVLTARDARYTEYRVTITDVDWRGTLRELQLCTNEGAIRAGESQSIDWIFLWNPTTRVSPMEWEFTSARTLYAAEAEAANNWATWRIETLLLGVSIAYGDGPWGIDRQRFKNEKFVDFLAMHQGAPGTEGLVLHEFDLQGDDIAKDWRFDTDVVGWTGLNVESLRWQNDAGTRVLSGSLDRRSIDPILYSMDNLKIPLGSTTEDNVHVRMKNSTRARTAKLYYITDADKRWSEARAVEFRIEPETGYRTYDIDMSRAEGWRNNTLFQLRLDPTEDATTREGSFKIDRIYIMDT